MFVCAPSRGRAGHAITTVDRSGADGYNDGLDPFDYADPNYTNTFNGTSSSAPLAAGVVALVLQANPDLTWRDVRYVLATSARMNDAFDSDWTLNGAGYSINHKYGFGVVDAAAAVALAQTWTNVGPLLTRHADDAAQHRSPTRIRSAFRARSSSPLGIQDIEQVEILFDADDHPYSGDLDLELVAPSGTVSVLVETRHPERRPPVPYDGFRFGSVRHLDEPADGTWTLTVRDLAAPDTGTFNPGVDLPRSLRRARSGSKHFSAIEASVNDTAHAVRWSWRVHGAHARSGQRRGGSGGAGGRGGLARRRQANRALVSAGAADVVRLLRRHREADAVASRGLDRRVRAERCREGGAAARGSASPRSAAEPSGSAHLARERSARRRGVRARREHGLDAPVARAPPGSDGRPAAARAARRRRRDLPAGLDRARIEAELAARNLRRERSRRRRQHVLSDDARGSTRCASPTSSTRRASWSARRPTG